MMECPLPSPIAPFMLLLHMMAKPPANHSHVSVQVIFPPGPIGPGFISPEPFHLPTNNPSRLCSGPGLGGPAGACAIASAPPSNTTTTNAARNFVWVTPPPWNEL